MISQHQYNGLAINESLSSVLDQHEDGLANELGEISEFAVLPKVRLVSLVTKGSEEFLIDKSYENIGKTALLADFRSELNAVLSPDYESDVKAGAGTTVKIID